MVRENPTWGEERIAAELSVKLGILVSPRTVRAYWPQDSDPRGCRRTSSQSWRSFVHNHAKAIVAADFLVAITAGFRVLYVFVVMEVGRRRILQCNVTAHPTAAWTLQQFREAIPSDHPYRFLIHDRDSIFSAEVHDDLEAFGLKVLRTPVCGSGFTATIIDDPMPAWDPESRILIVDRGRAQAYTGMSCPAIAG